MKRPLALPHHTGLNGQKVKKACIFFGRVKYASVLKFFDLYEDDCLLEGYLDVLRYQS